ncbi:pleckstrin homology domain-containing family F member 2 isoform X2 [Phacochoerus africanus]|uniref:pleckstrin homology domain-containing family F member 2 isoform X2 n=1 Tax=Phacochoerus africanus TaxID=41426 RepID=UPI001FD8E0AF|nr:pleckstrin homology domain-containing family F member 2 isoform X2 [Phacochoerus africanus]
MNNPFQGLARSQAAQVRRPTCGQSAPRRAFPLSTEEPTPGPGYPGGCGFRGGSAPSSSSRPAARAGRGNGQERAGSERCGCARARARGWRVGGGAPVRAQGRGCPRRPLWGSTGGAGGSPASGFDARPPRLDRAGCETLLAAHSGRLGRRIEQSPRPALGTRRSRTFAAAAAAVRARPGRELPLHVA